SLRGSWLCCAHLPAFTLPRVSSRGPPTSPLFPYTTLFRSPVSTHIAPEHSGADVLGCAAKCAFWPWKRRPAVAPRRVDVSRARTDRKSTRLNSSHVKISYAVFCLKKKTRLTTKQEARMGNS